jgi:mutator protein MutT
VPDIVNAVMLSDRRVLLAKRSAARRAYPGLWSFPGGHVEAGEDLAQALHRELGEEIGIVPTRYDTLGALADPQAADVTYHLFAVTGWQGEPQIVDHEHSALTWFDLDAAARLPAWRSSPIARCSPTSRAAADDAAPARGRRRVRHGRRAVRHRNAV